MYRQSVGSEIKCSLIQKCKCSFHIFLLAPFPPPFARPADCQFVSLLSVELINHCLPRWWAESRDLLAGSVMTWPAPELLAAARDEKNKNSDSRPVWTCNNLTICVISVIFCVNPIEITTKPDSPEAGGYRARQRRTLSGCFVYYAQWLKSHQIFRENKNISSIKISSYKSNIIFSCATLLKISFIALSYWN